MTPDSIIRREDEISLFDGKNPFSGMLNPVGILAVFLHNFADRVKPLTCAIFWFCFRWITGRTNSPKKHLISY